MDKLDNYRKIINDVLQYHANIPYSQGEIDCLLIVSEDRNHFLLMNNGWNDLQRIHGCLVHIEIIGDSVWILRDGIEDGVTDELVARGIPKDKIVLGFQPPEVRQYTGYGVA